ncbi:NB-ARC domain-containing protein [Haliangium sp.]|uniref:nSTAND1 domain-containing NTPase n=1 Tax=Haliangium sp. TaxID=2663208 RepID=UPI003D0D5C43
MKDDFVSDNQAELIDLLTSLFEADELRRFVRLLPQGRRLSAALPAGTASLDQLAFETATLLERHGLLGAPLFDSLLNARSYRADEIEAVRRLFAAADPSEQQDTVALESEMPYLEWFFGRDELAEELAARVARDRVTPIAILGPGGIGKSTLAIAAVHHDDVVARYGERRYFVRLDGAPSADAVLERLGKAVGLAGAVTLRDVRASLCRSPALLVLDNLETPWEHDTGSTEALLGQIGNVRGVALVITMRGATKPAGLAWDKPVQVERLSDVAAREMFCAIANPDAPDDPVVDQLVGALDGIPLAIKLLAHRAEGDILANLQAEWTRSRMALLLRPDMEPDRLSSWEISVELSWTSPRMTDAARRLASLLALLPDGVAVEDADALVPGHGHAAVRVLGQVALAYAEAPRLRMLAPVRQHLSAMHRPSQDDLLRTMEHYRALAADYERARPLFEQVGSVLGQADCIMSLGDLALRRSEHEQAKACYEQALSLFDTES